MTIYIIAGNYQSARSWCMDSGYSPYDPNVKIISRPEQLRGVRFKEDDLLIKKWLVGMDRDKYLEIMSYLDHALKYSDAKPEIRTYPR